MVPTQEEAKHWQFTHEATEAREGSWDTGLWIDFYQGIFFCVNVNLQQACPVQRTVHQHEQTLGEKKNVYVKGEGQI